MLACNDIRPADEPFDDVLDDFVTSLLTAIDPCIRFRKAIGVPDPWQRDVLEAKDPFVVVLASRQIGKSTAIACLAWAAFCDGKQVLLAAPSERQSKELLRRVHEFRLADPNAPIIIRSNLTELEGANGGRIVCVPATDQARGFTVELLILDEAAFLPDDAIAALLPMRTADGRVLMISTPRGRGGFFFDTWESGKVRRIFARSVDTPRLANKVEFDRTYMSSIRFAQEHECRFLGGGMPLISADVLDASVTASRGALSL
jgi:Terminase large subunit, T4likevirus-type, N-terminal